MFRYAGIGSRETPVEAQRQMFGVAQDLAPQWLLRSGHADGADQAFEEGCISAKGKMEIFIPWLNFNGAPNNDPRYIRPKATPDLAEYAASFHPAWKQCSDPAKLMHMRNVCQILGQYGDEPVDMVICWTRGAKGGGGTGQAIRIANFHNIPVFDIASQSNARRLCEFVTEIMKIRKAG